MTCKYELLDRRTLEECVYVDAGRSDRVKSPITHLFQELQEAHRQNVALQGEVSRLQDELAPSQTEVLVMKNKLLDQQTTHNVRIDQLLQHFSFSFLFVLDLEFLSS